MSDVRLYNTADGGDIEFASDDIAVTDIKLDSGLETAAYLSLFGGNERDPGVGADESDPNHPHRFQWWGNFGEPVEKQMRSQFAYLLKDLPAISSNLLRLEDAAKRDLAWFTEGDVASEVDVTVSLVARNRIQVAVKVIVVDETFEFVFNADWRGE